MPSIPPNPRLEKYYTKTLAPALRGRCPTLDLLECGTVALMSYLGPPESKIPPTVLVNECLALVREYTRTRPQEQQDKWLVQVVLAYGCGWQRCAQSGEQRWDTLWPGAVQELVEITENFVARAVKILCSSVRNFTGLGPREQTEYAEMIASIFVGRMPDPKVKYTQYQSITTWDPHRGNLYGWLQHAVQGMKEQQ